MKFFSQKRNTVAIVTEVGSRLGDVSAAKQFADQVRSNFDHLDVALVLFDIRTDISVILEESNYMEIDGEINKGVLSEKFLSYIKDEGISKIIFYPNISSLTQSMIDEIKIRVEPLTVDIFRCYEYDYFLNPGFRKDVQVTGLSRGSLGCFLCDKPDYDALLETEFSKTMKAVIENKPLEKIFSNLHSEQLLNEQVIFMGYHNPERNSMNSEFTPENYASLCYKVALEEKRKHIFFIINKTNLDEIADVFLQEGAKEIELMDSNGDLSSKIKGSNLELGLKVTLIDPYPLPMNVFDNLQKLSHPFIYLTGDQSASRGLSTYHFLYKSFGIVFYQIKDWKRLFYYSLLERAVEYLGMESPYTKFVHLVSGEKLLDEASKKEMVTLILDKRMGEETKKFFHAINESYNFANNVKKFFETRIEEVPQSETFFIDYRISFDFYIFSMIDFPQDIYFDYDDTRNKLASLLLPEIAIVDKSHPEVKTTILMVSDNQFLVRFEGFTFEERAILQKTFSNSNDRESDAMMIQTDDLNSCLLFLSTHRNLDIKIDSSKVDQLKNLSQDLRKVVLEYEFPHSEMKEGKETLVFKEALLDKSNISKPPLL